MYRPKRKRKNKYILVQIYTNNVNNSVIFNHGRVFFFGGVNS